MTAWTLSPVSVVLVAALACTGPSPDLIERVQEGESSSYEVETAQYATCNDRVTVYVSAWSPSSRRTADNTGIELFLFVDAGAVSSGYLIKLDQTEVAGPGLPVAGDVAFDGVGRARFAVAVPGKVPITLSASNLGLIQSEDVCKRLDAPFYASRNPSRSS